MVSDHHIELLKREIKTLKEMLEPLELGKMHIGERNPHEPWLDRKQVWINHLKRTIDIYEIIVERHDATRT